MKIKNKKVLNFDWAEINYIKDIVTKTFKMDKSKIPTRDVLQILNVNSFYEIDDNILLNYFWSFCKGWTSILTNLEAYEEYESCNQIKTIIERELDYINDFIIDLNYNYCANIKVRDLNRELKAVYNYCMKCRDDFGYLIYDALP